jgi:hypothetical protein
MDRERIDTISRILASGLSRREVLRVLGVGGAGGILVVGPAARAGERPHENLLDRTPQRNRKQRNNKNKNNKNQNQNNDNETNGGGGQLGGWFSLGCSVAFRNQNSDAYAIEVIGENGDLFLDCPPGFNATLSADDTAVEFNIYHEGWAKGLYIVAVNPDVGEPEVKYRQAGGCDKGAIDCTTTQSLSVGEAFTLDWNGASFYVERQSDSTDYKMFLVTALAG